MAGNIEAKGFLFSFEQLVMRPFLKVGQSGFRHYVGRVAEPSKEIYLAGFPGALRALAALYNAVDRGKGLGSGVAERVECTGPYQAFESAFIECPRIDSLGEIKERLKWPGSASVDD